MAKSVVEKTLTRHITSGEAWSSKPAGGGEGFTPEAGFSVEGTFADGGTITITRGAGGFGTKTNVKPLWWVPLETDFDAHATLSRTTGTLPAVAHTRVIQTSVMPTNAAGAAAIAGETGGARLFGEGISFSTRELYVFMKRRYSHDIAANLKNIRMWSAGFTSPDLYFSHSDGGNVQTYIEDFDVETFTTGNRYNSLAWTKDAWVTDEYVYQGNSALDAVDGLWNMIRNSRLTYPTTQLWQTRTTAQPGPMVDLYLDQYSTSSPGGFVYYNSLYIDDSPRRLFISPESSFNTSTTLGSDKREILIPTAWSDTQISAVLRLGENANFSGQSLYVMTAPYTAMKVGSFD